MDPINPSQSEEIDLALRTRSGYIVADAIHSFKISLEQSGAEAAGKSLHSTADLICSGCLQIWQKLLWDYTLDHIGLASPRIFWFLKNRFTHLDEAWAKAPAEAFYRNIEHQKTIAEILLVIRSQPRRPMLKLPKVATESHSEAWIQSMGQVPPSAAVGRVFRGSNDLQVLRKVGDAFAQAIADGATEKAFWWLKWCFEEDSRLRKDGGGSLSTMERGPIQWPSKQRSHVGFYLIRLLIELYKDLSPKTGMRMMEEFQAIFQLYSFPDKRISQKRRFDLICLAIQILCDVPRWKVPAAPALVKDPVALERAISHAESFFREVLAYDPPSGDISKEAKKGAPKSVTQKKQLTGKQLKQMSIDEHLNAYDAMINGWMNGKG